MIKIPGLTLLLSDAADMSIEDWGCNPPRADDANNGTDFVSAQSETENRPIMEKMDSLAQLPVEVKNLSILTKRTMESQDGDGSKRQKTDTSAPVERLKTEMTDDGKLSTSSPTQEKTDPDAPEITSSETLTKKQLKKRNQRLRVQAAQDALRKQTAQEEAALQNLMQQAAKAQELATQKGEALQLRARQHGINHIPTMTNYTPVAAAPQIIPVFMPPIPPIIFPPIVVPPNTISTENWLRAGVPKSPFNETPYSQSELETAWQSFDLALPNIYQFPIPHLIIVRHHFLSTLWRYAKVKGTHHVTTPPIGGIGFQAMKYLIHRLGCPIVLQTGKPKQVYILELKYVPVAPKGGKGYKFLEDAVSVEAEKAALTSLEKTWRAKLACAAIEKSFPSTTISTPTSPTSDVHNSVSAPPKAQLQSGGCVASGAQDSRLAELRSKLERAKKPRSSTQRPDERTTAIEDQPPVLLPKTRVPRRKAVDFFEDIASQRIPSPPLIVPEGDHWCKLNYEKRMEKVDLGAIDAFLGIVLEL